MTGYAELPGDMRAELRREFIDETVRAADETVRAAAHRALIALLYEVTT